MKKILLLGDSIRLHYGPYVKLAFKETAKVFYPSENRRFAEYLFRYLYLDQTELGLDETLDAVHWNAGLWDVLVMPDGETLTPPETYRYYLDRISRTLRTLYPQAKIIFATSTAVIEDDTALYKRYNRQIQQYNAIAGEVALAHGFQINDLYALTENIPAEFHSDNTHFNTPEGAKLLAEQVVNTLEEALDIRGTKLDFAECFREETDIVGI